MTDNEQIDEMMYEAEMYQQEQESKGVNKMTYKIKSAEHNELVTGTLTDATNRAQEIVDTTSAKNRVRVICEEGLTWFDSADKRTLTELLDDTY